MGNSMLRNLFWAISFFGTPFFYIPVTAYFLRINPNPTISLILILASNEIICGAIKFVYPKERPIPMLKNTLFQKYLAGSFPSIHTARITAFSIAIVSFYTNRLFILIALLVVIGVGYS